MIKKIRIAILWLIPIIFFFMVSFGLFSNMGLNKGEEIIRRIVPFTFLAGTTILAWVISIKYYPKIKDKISKPITLLFIPITFVYTVLVEVSFNFNHFLEPGAMMNHLTYHIFEDVYIIIPILILMWLVFRKFEVGWKTILISYILGVFFQWFFGDGEGEGPRSIIFGTIWIWLLHVNWFITLIFVRSKKLLH